MSNGLKYIFFGLGVTLFAYVMRDKKKLEDIASRPIDRPADTLVDSAVRVAKSARITADKIGQKHASCAGR